MFIQWIRGMFIDQRVGETTQQILEFIWLN